MKGEKLFEAFSDLSDELLQDLDHAPVKHSGGLVRRVLLAAAVISLLTISAIGSVMGSAEIRVTPHEDGCMVMFLNRSMGPVEQVDWYPLALPEGYSVSMIDSNEHHFRSIAFEDGDDGKLRLTYGPARYMPGYVVEGTSEGVHTKVGGDQALLFTTVTPATDYSTGAPMEIQVHAGWLFWFDEESKHSFVLRYAAKEELDLVAIAESVTPTDPLVFTYKSFADAAVVKMGDYQPMWLPDGYRLVDTYGFPTSANYGVTERGYVHRLYRNAENYEVHLYYEYIPRRHTSNVSELHGAEPMEQIDLNGIPAQYYETEWGVPLAVVWEREDAENFPLTFTLYSDGLSTAQSISKEDLIRMAEQITLVAEADTTHFERRPR